jgi:hypothetical protein
MQDSQPLLGMKELTFWNNLFATKTRLESMNKLQSLQICIVPGDVMMMMMMMIIIIMY